MISLDTNILFLAKHSTAPLHNQARSFVADVATRTDVVLCELVLVELYILVRNPTVIDYPMASRDAVEHCRALRENPNWHVVENAPVMDEVWKQAGGKNFARRRIIDVRLALTLQHHGVTEFATTNVKDFRSLGFRRVWNPLDE